MNKYGRIIGLKLGMALFCAVALATAAFAEDPKPVAPTISADDLKKALGMSIYLQGGYTFNFRSPDSGTNEERIFDQKANTLLIDLVQVQFLKDPAVGGLGYKLKGSFGETAKYIHSAGLGSPDDPYDLTEAYVDYIAPLGKGLRLQMGKFATYLGFEVIEAKNNFNYSRSYLFNFSTPNTHTGFMAGYKFSQALTTNLYWVNGWDQTTGTNRWRTFGASFILTPLEPVQLTFNFIYGPEQSASSSNNRFLFDWIGAFSATKNLKFVANVDYGHEDKVPPNNGQDSEWYAVTLYAKYNFTEFFSACIRAEYFDDRDGVRTGIVQQLKEITITNEFKIMKDLLVRPEYRHDWSDQNAFDSAHNTRDTKSQDTIALGVMYTW